MKTAFAQGAVLPTDGSALVIPLEPGQTQITLSGQVHFALTDQSFDGGSADQSGALIQLEPGQWHVVKADAASHVFTLSAPGLEANAVSVRLQVDQLVDQFLESPATIQSNLHSALTVHPEAAPLPLGGFNLTNIAGVAVVLMLVVVAGLQTRKRRAQNADVSARLTRIRTIADQLAKRSSDTTMLPAAARDRVQHMVQTAKMLGDSVRMLRHKLSQANLPRIRAEVARLRSKGAGQDGPSQPVLKERERALSLLEPLQAREKTLTEGLELIESTLESLHAASLAFDTGQADQEGQKAAELLERADRELHSAIKAQQEMKQF